ncbi:Ig-like domain-containing protein [Arcticibacterium luteifluviistationis]|uniref:Ig-like domain-containing protein n=1 Tax=Arcticibacterium luteifluviistationis TaxID=1784714 RepID=A0A2Z4GIH5_9BACT|nr:T9SS type A sorting domain-containing protein [Arcticibacterium luteifluviistationis]AWW00654.1 hypothetical protein DJ013_21685 [Arcticibacterium luteifluviistationis]
MKEFYLSILFSIVSLISFAQNPTITTQPYLNGGFVCYGTDAEIRANVTNADTYQLQTKNTVLNTYSDFGGYTGNATTGAITINLANVTQELTLRVTFTNANGTTNSDDFQVFAQRPSFTIQPQNQVQCSGEDIYFYMDEVAGNTYEWERSNNGAAFSTSGFASKIKNENTSTLWIDGANSAEENDSFRCKVTDANGCENTSNAGTISINSSGTIQPTSSTEFCEDGFANFSLNASGVKGTIDSYQWTANDGTSNFSGSEFEEVSALSFNVNKVPANLSGVEVTLQFTNSLMQPNGSLAGGTCAYTKERAGGYYTTNPKPVGPTAIAADSVCGSGVVNLEVTDSRTDWNWSATADGAVLGTGKTFATPSLSSSAFYYVSYTDANNCKSGPDSVLATVNPLPTLTLGTIAPVCPGVSTFEIPYTNLSAGADKFSLTLSSGTMPDFAAISDAAITATALTIALPSNAANGNYTFNLVLGNSATECLSEVIPVNLYIQKATSITTQPMVAEICEGESHTFSVVGDGEGTVTYQWYFETNLISGAESASYQISNAALSNGGSYHCKVTATCGFVNSSAVALTVKPKTKISTQPVSETVCEGSELSFSVAATGSGTLTYQWKKDGNNVGTNSNTLSLTDVSASDNGAKITCMVQGDCGDSLSAEATLTVYALPLAPAVVDTGYCLNSTPNALTAMASGSNQLNWYGNSETGGTASSVAPSPSTSAAGTVNYYVSQTDANSCESDRAVIQVKVTNAVTANLSTSTSAVCAHGEINKTVLFTIAGQNGDGNYVYQWGKDNVDINSETNETYTGSGAGDYYVKVVSGYCDVTKTATINSVLASENQGPTISGSGLVLPYTVCPSGSATFSATTNTAGTDFKWYASPTGNVSLNNSAIYNISNILSDRTYYAAVQQTDGLTTCETERTAVSIAVYDAPSIIETITPESCQGEGDGSFSLAPQTGNIPYQFKLDAGSFQTGNVFNNLTAQAYQITLQDNKGCSATTSLNMTAGAAPVFTTQPLSQTNCDGNTVTFETITDAAYTMSWEKKLPDGDWAVIAGETDVDLRLTNVGNATNPHGTSYRATAASSSCSTVSDEVVLSVNDYAENLASQDVCAGDLVTWIPPATVGTIQNYEWQRKVSGGSFVVAQSGTSPNYVINAVTGGEEADQYRVKITFGKTGGTCLETSDGGTLNVTEVTETTLTGTIEICEGESTPLTATGCNGTVTWSDIQEGESISVSPSETTVYTAVCDLNNCSVPASNNATVTVKPGIPAPTITATKKEVCFGDSTTLSVAGCGGAILWSSGENTMDIIAKSIGTVTYSATCSDLGCTSPVSNTIDITSYPELIAGSISESSDVNCAGFNPSTISNETSPMGGNGTLTISWEVSENCSDVSPTWAMVPSVSGETFNPTALIKTTCYRRKVVDECGTEVYSNISTIEIVDDPSVTVSSSESSICSNQSFTLTATVMGGTGVCNIIWQRNLKSSASGSSFWEDIPGTALTNTISDLENTGAATISVYFRAIYDCDLTNCNKATSDVFEVQVAPQIAVNVSSDKNDICEGESINVSAKGCHGNLTWFDANSDSLRGLSPTSSGYLVATCSISGCATVAKDSVEIMVRPGISAPTITATKSEICFGDSVTISIAGCSGDILWSNGETTSEIVVKPTSLVTYSTTCSANSCTSPTSNTIDVQGYPELIPGSIGISSDVNCAGFNPATISNENDAVGGKGVLSISWEMSEDCSALSPIWTPIPNETGMTFNPSTIQKTTCYRRKVMDECGTEVYSNVSTIEIVDDPSVIVSSTESSICSNQSFTLTATVNGGTGVCSTIWQRNLKSSASGSSFWEDIPGTALTNTISDLENTEAATISVYYRAIYDCDLTNCNKATSDAFEVQVLPSSEVALNISDSTVCIGNSVLLTASSCGGTLTWSDGGEGVLRTIEITGSASYTATCTSACGTYTATANLNAIPGFEPPVNTTPISAIQPDILTFSAAGTNLKWYASATVDTSLYAAPTESEIGEYTYYVSQSNSTCESPRIEINAAVYSPLTIVNQPADQFDCEGNSVYFSVEAIGAGTIFYQWQRKRPGETEFTDLKDDDEGIKFPLTRNLRVSAVGDNDNPVLSEYRCRMSDSLSYIQTYERVLYANVIDGTIPNVEACVGTDFEFRLYDFVRTTGDIMSFQWQIRDDVIDKWIDISDDFRTSGSQTANMTIKNIQTYDNRKYRCSLVFNTGGFQCTENTDQTILKVGSYPNRPPDLSAEYCQGKTTKTLSFNGKPNDELWYTHENKEAIGFKKAPKPSSDEAGVFTWWFTEITDENCESPKAKYTVIIHPEPEAPASIGPQFVNEGDTLFFDANGENLHWFTSRTGKAFTTETPAYTEIDEYKHYVSQSNDFGCESDRTLIISFIRGTLGFKKELEDRADCDGNSVRFVANGKGLGSLEYLWERKLPNDTLFREIEGETGSTLLVSKIGSEDNPHKTQFRVKVSDTTGVETSNAAYLLVNEITGSLNAQYYCTDDNWRVNLDSLNIQGKVNEYQLQVQPERSWVTLDTVFNIDSTRILSFYGLKDSVFTDSDYRIRMVFEAENGGTCARSTDEFNFRLDERPKKPEKLTEEICQYSEFELPAMDSLNYVWFETQNDTSLLTMIPLDSSGMFEYYYAHQDSITGCYSEKDTLQLGVLPVDSVFLMNNEFVFCTEDSTAILNIDGISNYSWYASDSLKTVLGDTLEVVLNEAQQETYLFETKYENGCTSPLTKIIVKVESCEANTPVEGEDNVAVNNVEGEPVCVTYPNPAKPNQTVDLYTENLVYESVEVFNSQGQTVPNTLYGAKGQSQKMSLNSDLRDGVYILRILGEYGNHCQWKMVVRE